MNESEKKKAESPFGSWIEKVESAPVQPRSVASEEAVPLSRWFAFSHRDLALGKDRVRENEQCKSRLEYIAQ